MTDRAMICRTANKLVKQGFTRSEAFKKAWALAKLPEITVKVKGVTFGNRQTALEHLTHYSPADVSFIVAADVNNAADSNAVAVVAKVRNRGAALIGYLPKELAADLSPLMRAGVALKTSGAVTGGYYPYMNYGARVTLKFA